MSGLEPAADLYRFLDLLEARVDFYAPLAGRRPTAEARSIPGGVTDLPLDELTRRQAARVASDLELRVGQTVLDVGCGHGRMARALQRVGADVVGLDLDPAVLGRAARWRAGPRSVRPAYLRGDWAALPFREASFDAVLLLLSPFGTLARRAAGALLRRLRSLLRPSGRLWLDVLNRDALFGCLPRTVTVERGPDVVSVVCEPDYRLGAVDCTRWLARPDGSYEGASGRVYAWSPTELAALVARAGLRVVELRCGDAGAPAARLELVAERGGGEAR